MENPFARLKAEEEERRGPLTHSDFAHLLEELADDGKVVSESTAKKLVLGIWWPTTSKTQREWEQRLQGRVKVAEMRAWDDFKAAEALGPAEAQDRAS